MPNWKYIWWDIEERWERLGLRNWVNNNPKIVLGISITTVVIFLLIVIAQCMPYRPPNPSRNHKVWFYDLNTNKLFAADSDNVPPIDTPSGKLPDGQQAGVKAYVVSYVREPNESERFIAYLEKYTPQGKKIISLFKKSKKNVTKEMLSQLNKNRFVCGPVDKKWFLADSNEGRGVLKQASRINEKGQMPNYYSPR